MIRTIKIEVPLNKLVKDEVLRVLQSVAFAIRATKSLVTKFTPGQMINGRDMITYQVSLSNWDLVREQRQISQIKNNKRENRGRTNHIWAVGQLRLIITKKDERGRKLINYKHKGPFEIIKVYNNGPVKIRKKNFDEVISTRSLRPYIEEERENT